MVDQLKLQFYSDWKMEQRKLESIANFFGKENQCDKMIEECAELIKAIENIKKAKEYDEKLLDELAGEIADVRVVSEQMIYLFGFDKDLVEAIENGKIDRTIYRVNKEYGAGTIEA